MRRIIVVLSVPMIVLLLLVGTLAAITMSVVTAALDAKPAFAQKNPGFAPPLCIAKKESQGLTKEQARAECIPPDVPPPRP